MGASDRVQHTPPPAFLSLSPRNRITAPSNLTLSNIMASAYNTPLLDWETLCFHGSGVKDGSNVPEEENGDFFIDIGTLDPAMEIDLDLAGLGAGCQNSRSDSISSINTAANSGAVPWAPTEPLIDEIAADGSLGAEYSWQQPQHQHEFSSLQSSAQLQNRQPYGARMARTHVADNIPGDIIELPISPQPGRSRIIRRQNHACDACRVAKKACDLPPRWLRQRQGQGRDKHAAAKVTCSLCATRGTECTVSWLENKPLNKKNKPLNKKPRQPCTPTSNATAAAVPQPFSHSATTMSLENDIARQIIARDTRDIQFNFYIDSFEMPIAHCLLRGSMPPIYKLGLEAVNELAGMSSMRQYMEQAEAWVKMCGEASNNDTPWTGSINAAPHLFRAVSVLDAVFETVLFPRIAKSRQASITETYRQVALATASQYTVKGPAATPSTPSRGHDISLVTFRKARDLTFSNISTVGSFRLSFAMLLLGAVAPPGCAEELESFLQDSRYLFQKGQRRLQTLCARALTALQPVSGSREQSTKNPHAHAHSVPTLPSEAAPLVAELVGVLQWFVDLCQSVLISTSQPQLHRPIPSDGSSLGADSPAIIDSFTGTDASPTDLAIMLAPQAREAEDSIVALAKSSPCSLLSQLRRGTVLDDALLVDGTTRVVSVAVLLWKSLGRLSMAAQGVLQGATSIAAADAVEPLYIGMSALVRLWRGNFGTLDTRYDTRSKLLPDERSPALWRLLSLCSNDSDLAILLFCSLATALQQHIEDAPESLGLRNTHLYKRLREDSAFMKEQRLVSAKQTIIMAQAAQSQLENSASSSRARSLCLLSMNTVSFYYKR